LVLVENDRNSQPLWDLEIRVFEFVDDTGLALREVGASYPTTLLRARHEQYRGPRDASEDYEAHMRRYFSPLGQGRLVDFNERSTDLVGFATAGGVVRIDDQTGTAYLARTLRQPRDLLVYTLPMGARADGDPIGFRRLPTIQFQTPQWRIALARDAAPQLCVRGAYLAIIYACQATSRQPEFTPNPVRGCVLFQWYHKADFAPTSSLDMTAPTPLAQRLLLSVGGTVLVVPGPVMDHEGTIALSAAGEGTGSSVVGSRAIMTASPHDKENTLTRYIHKINAPAGSYVGMMSLTPGGQLWALQGSDDDSFTRIVQFVSIDQ